MVGVITVPFLKLPFLKYIGRAPARKRGRAIRFNLCLRKRQRIFAAIPHAHCGALDFFFLLYWTEWWIDSAQLCASFVVFVWQLSTHAEYRNHLNWSGAVITPTTGELNNWKRHFDPPEAERSLFFYCRDFSASGALVRSDENYLLSTISRKGLQRKAHSGAA